MEINSDALKRNIFWSLKSWVNTSLMKNFVSSNINNEGFLKKKIFENKPFMLKMQKWREKVYFMMSYFKIVDIWIKMKINKKLHINIRTKKQRITENG